MKLIPYLRAAAVVGTFATGASVALLRYGRVYDVTRVWTCPTVGPCQPNPESGAAYWDPPWVLMIVIGLTAAVATYWMMGNLANAIGHRG
jgi:hypothetical protein